MEATERDRLLQDVEAFCRALRPIEEECYLERRFNDRVVSLAKLHASRAACDAADHAVQVFGGRGFLEAFRPGRHFQDTRVCRLYEGTDEILTLKIAAAVLGKDYEAFQ